MSPRTGGDKQWEGAQSGGDKGVEKLFLHLSHETCKYECERYFLYVQAKITFIIAEYVLMNLS